MIRDSLTWKLTLAFLVVGLVAAALLALFIRLTSVNRLVQLVLDQQRSSLQAALADYYAERGSWQGIRARWRQVQLGGQPDWMKAQATQLPGAGEGLQKGGGAFNRRQGVADRLSLFGLADESGRVIVPALPGYPAGMQVPAAQLRRGTPVEVDGERVGTILTANLSPRFSPEENLFLQRLNEALVFAAAGALLAALLVGVLLARTLIQPLQALTHAARDIAAGRLGQQVEVRSQDEIGQLAGAFNRMSLDLARVNQQRKQMTADIAHDLRTPLTVIGGYVEAMRDGVLQPTAERMALIYSEIERLQRLVDDLRMLSQVDAGELKLNPQRLAPGDLLERAAAPFQLRAAQQKVTLAVEAAPGLPEVRVDEARMLQVFGNLLSNALRYTPEGGRILLTARRNGDQVVMAVEDTGSGIAEEDLPFIFDRFHRADKSRHSEAGESGLGLAIAKALVEAHGGTIQATSRVNAGTRIEIRLPVEAA